MCSDSIVRDWHGKPYYSLDSYCKNTFHHKCYKIALNARMSCQFDKGLEILKELECPDVLSQSGRNSGHSGLYLL